MLVISKATFCKRKKKIRIFIWNEIKTTTNDEAELGIRVRKHTTQRRKTELCGRTLAYHVESCFQFTSHTHKNRKNIYGLI